MDRSNHVKLTEIGEWQNPHIDDMSSGAAQYLEKIRTRHTIRDFTSDPVPQVVIDLCLMAAGTAPSGANHQPWHFVAVQDADIKRKIRIAAEEEERSFYGKEEKPAKAGDQWLDALKPIGTNDEKPFLEKAPWLIAIFAQKKFTPYEPYARHEGAFDNYDWQADQPEADHKNYYVSESVGIATGMLISALHNAGLATLTHTPAPMGFLSEILQRPKNEKPFLLLVVGKAAQDASIPKYALHKKSLDDLRSVF